MADTNRPATRPALTPLEDRTVPAGLSGFVYADLNGNDIKDATEAGVAGATVQLDENSQGRVSATAVTDAAGRYTFTGTGAGTHTAAAAPAAGTAALGGATTQIIISAETAATPAGAAADIALRPTGSVQGRVYADQNGNGARDAAEPGVSGALVSADLNNDGTVEFTTTTQADGSYSLLGIPDGVTKVTVGVPIGYSASGDPAQLATVSGGKPATLNPVGLRATSGVSGRVTMSLDPTVGVAGVTVLLDPAADGATGAQSAVTDAAGNYAFTSVPAGAHTLKVLAPAGTQFVTADGSGALKADVVAPVPGQIGGVTGVDVQLKYPGIVTSSMFLDVNGDGVYTAATDRGQAPGSVQLALHGSGKLVTVAPVVQPDGTFRIDGVPDGTHYLVATPPAGYSASGGSTRARVTVTNGSAEVVDAVAVEATGATGGDALAIGSSGSPRAQLYTFAPGEGGKLSATPGAAITNPGTAGTRVTMADFNGDGTADVITATGPGDAPTIRVYDGRTNAELVSIQAFEATFKGGVNIAAGDFNKDGKADIVAAADVGGGPRVRIFNAAQFQAGADPAQGKLFADFFAIEDAKFRGGTRVAVGDLNRDGSPDLVVAAGAGGGPRVAVFDGSSLTPGQARRKLVSDFFVFESALRNGAVVSVGDVNGDGTQDLVAGAGMGGAPRVVVFSGTDILAGAGTRSARIADFYVHGDVTSRAGTTVTVKDVDDDGKADVVASNGGRASVFTSTSLVAHYLNPQPGGPAAAADLTPFTDAGAISLG